MQAKSAGHSRLVVIWRTRILATLVVLASVGGPAQSFAQTDATYSDGRVNQPSDGQTRKQAARRLSTMTDATNNDTVGRLIDSLVASDRETVQAAVTALVLLGHPAVPEMIRRIDDRREMPVKVVALDNTEPSAFEAVAHLGVDKVIDCLNLILTSTERKIVGHIDADPVDPNDAGSKHSAEAQRDAVAAGWRRHLAGLSHTPPAPGKSLPLPGSCSRAITLPLRRRAEIHRQDGCSHDRVVSRSLADVGKSATH